MQARVQTFGGLARAHHQGLHRLHGCHVEDGTVRWLGTAGGQHVSSRVQRHAVDAAVAELGGRAPRRPGERDCHHRHVARVHRQQSVALGAHRHAALVQPRLSKRPLLNKITQS